MLKNWAIRASLVTVAGAAVLTGLGVTVSTQAAFAGPCAGCGGGPSGGNGGYNVIVYTCTSGACNGNAGGNNGGAGGDYKVPTCYYVPYYTTQQFKDAMGPQLNELGGANYGEDARLQDTKWMQQNDDLLKDPKADPTGRWWFWYCDTLAADYNQQAGAQPTYIYAPLGNPPAGAITVPDLAALARAHLTLPPPDVRTSPEAGDTYNALKAVTQLPTYVNVTGPGEQSATAAVVNWPGMEATVYADIAPDMSFQLIVGSDATTSGPCVPNAGLNGPCGVTFHQASTKAAFTVRVTWNVVSRGVGARAFPPDFSERVIGGRADQVQSVNGN